MLFHEVSGSGASVIVVANSIDQDCNSDFVDFLKSERDVNVVHPSEFELYSKSAYIVIVGGNEAPEGTGEIVDSALTEEEKVTTEEGCMVVKLNVWQEGQVVVVIAGQEREQTKKACEENKKNVSSLFDGVETILKAVEKDYDLIIFLWPTPLLPTDVIAPYASSPLPLEVTEVPYLVPYSLHEDSWFFWIDDAPYAKYAHTTRFVFFGIETRGYSVYQEEWWPVLNRKPLWVEPDQYWDKAFWVYNPGLEPTISSSVTDSTKPGELTNDRGLIINGWSNGQPMQEDMSADERGMKEALTKLGMRVESVHTKEEIQYVLHRWAQEMEPSDTLAVYVTAHGGRGYILVNGKVFKVSELVTLLSDFNVHIHVLIDASYSGSFIYLLKTRAETVITSTNELTPAYGDYDPEDDINPSDKGSEFTSGLVACIKELARNKEKIEEWKKQAAAHDKFENEERGKSWYTYLLTEAFKTARELDAAFVKGYTNPEMWGLTEITVTQQKHKGGCSCGG